MEFFRKYFEGVLIGLASLYWRFGKRAFAHICY